MTTALIKSLHEKRLNAWEQAKAINEASIAESRDGSLSAEETASWEKANADMASLDARLASLIDAEARNAAIPEALGNAGAPPAGGNDALVDEFRAVANGEKRGIEIRPTATSVREARDLVKGTTTAGGNTIKTSFYDQLLAHLIEVSGVLMAGPTILQTAGGENFEVPVTTAHSSAALTAEAAAISESDPAFGKRTLGAYKYGVITQVARELVDDTSVDLLGYLAMQAGRACGNALGVDLVTGNASSKPSGILQTSTLGVTGSTGVVGVFTFDNLIDLYYSVIAPYRNSPSCAWMFKDSSLASVRKLKDTNGSYLWTPAATVGQPDSILGKPVFTDPNVPATAVGAKSVIFGDISQYFVRLAGGVRFERSDEFAFNTDLVTFKCVVRGDGILADQTGAVKHYLGAAS